MALGTAQSRTQDRRAAVEDVLYGRDGLNMRERAAVRAAHGIDVNMQTTDGRPRWFVACSCGWGTDTTGGAGDAHDLHAMHVGGWYEHAAREKRANAAVERALEHGDALTRERFATAEADAAVTSIAPTPEPWTIGRPGTAAHLLLDPGQVAVCGRHLGYGILTAARAYHKRCASCVAHVGRA